MTTAPEVLDDRHTPWWRRARSGVLLLLFSAALGAATAAVVGVAAVAIVSALDHALG